MKWWLALMMGTALTAGEPPPQLPESFDVFITIVIVDEHDHELETYNDIQRVTLVEWLKHHKLDDIDTADLLQNRCIRREYRIYGGVV